MFRLLGKPCLSVGEFIKWFAYICGGSHLAFLCSRIRALNHKYPISLLLNALAPGAFIDESLSCVPAEVMCQTQSLNM